MRKTHKTVFPIYIIVIIYVIESYFILFYTLLVYYKDSNLTVNVIMFYKV